MEENESIYDFNGISLDLNRLRITERSYDENDGDNDDEEWYPPTPPPYDVKDKLVEINERFRRDPTSTIRITNRLQWRADLVQIKWLNGSTESDEEYSSSSESEDIPEESISEQTIAEKLSPVKPVLKNRETVKDEIYILEDDASSLSSLELRVETPKDKESLKKVNPAPKNPSLLRTKSYSISSNSSTSSSSSLITEDSKKSQNYWAMVRWKRRKREEKLLQERKKFLKFNIKRNKAFSQI